MQDRHDRLANRRRQRKPRRLHDPDQRQPGRKRDPEDRPQRGRCRRPRRRRSTSSAWATTKASAAASSTARAKSRSTTTFACEKMDEVDGQGRLRQLGTRPTRSPAAPSPPPASTWPRSRPRPASRPRSSSPCATTNGCPSRRSSTCCRSPPTRPTTSSAASRSTTATTGENTVSGTEPRGQGLLRPALQPRRRRRTTGSSAPTSTCSQWLERQGYDVSYTDDVHLQSNPAELHEHNTVVISGHSEYWSLTQFNGFKAARDAGVNIASFSANTAYWKVRYEDGNRTLVCYKTVEGSGSEGNGTVSDNDWGPDGIKGTADDALGLDGKAGTADDNPQNATTTWRDNGAPPGDPNAPPGGRVGPDMPENQLFGIMYVGDNDAYDFPVTVPPGERQRRIRRRPASGATPASRRTRPPTSVDSWSTGSGTRSRPRRSTSNTSPPASSASPRPTSRSPKTTPGSRTRGACATPRRPRASRARSARSSTPPPSGALVFASGHDGAGPTASPANVDDTDRAGDLQHLLRHGRPARNARRRDARPGWLQRRRPTAGFTISPNPTKTATTVTFDASARTTPTARSSNTNGTSTATAPSRPTRAPARPPRTPTPAEGEFDVRLRVTDNGGATDLAVQHDRRCIDNQPPTAAFTVTPNAGVIGEPVDLQRLRLRATPTARSPNTNGTSTATARYETNARLDPDDQPHLLEAKAPRQSACG